MHNNIILKAEELYAPVVTLLFLLQVHKILKYIMVGLVVVFMVVVLVCKEHASIIYRIYVNYIYINFYNDDINQIHNLGEIKIKFF